MPMKEKLLHKIMQSLIDRVNCPPVVYEDEKVRVEENGIGNFTVTLKDEEFIERPELLFRPL